MPAHSNDSFDSPHNKPSRTDCLSAKNKNVPDVIAPGLKVLFAGINPGLYSAAVQHHFARPGNRFWPTLYRARFTPRQFSPFEEQMLLELGLGITNIIPRATAGADELEPKEYPIGAGQLRQKVLRYRPRVLAILGIGAYRLAFNCKNAVVGLQNETIGSTRLWVLPNPSGLNAHYQRSDLARVFAELRRYRVT